MMDIVFHLESFIILKNKSNLLIYFFWLCYNYIVSNEERKYIMESIKKLHDKVGKVGKVNSKFVKFAKFAMSFFCMAILTFMTISPISPLSLVHFFSFHLQYYNTQYIIQYVQNFSYSLYIAYVLLMYCLCIAYILFNHSLVILGPFSVQSRSNPRLQSLHCPLSIIAKYHFAGKKSP